MRIYFENERTNFWVQQYDRLSNFMLENKFTRGKVDTTLFCKTFKNYILIVQIYIDDIIFGYANPSLCEEF